MDRVSEPSTAPARPPQVTVACGIVMVGSVFVVLSVWDRIAGLHTIDTREALRPWLDEPVMRSSGITMSDLLVTVKVAVPPNLEGEAAEALETYAKAERASGFDPRAGWAGSL